MLKFQDGDRSAFDELVRRNTPKVHALIYRFLGDPSLVEDLTQEVFMRVFRTVERYQPTAKFSTWLYRITANLAFNVVRSRRKGVPRSLDAFGADDPDAPQVDVHADRQDAPHEDLHTDELRNKIAEAIDELPENQRTAIILNKYEDMSYDDIAGVLGCSTMAVKSLLSRARGNLRSSLRPYVDM